MMYYIFKRVTEFDTTYFFYEGIYWSSDFDSLTQLIDVGKDDPDYINNPRLRNYDPEEFAEELSSDTDKITYLCKIKNLEDLPQTYPEIFL